LRASINDAIIQKPRHKILILIVARFSSRMSRYTTDADAASVVILRGPAIVNRSEIILPEGATEAQINAAITALAALGIILR
jgi:hypothetical protein